MIITNKHDMPIDIYEQIKRDNQYKPKSNIIRVTEVIGPPLIRQLLQKHCEPINQQLTEW